MFMQTSSFNCNTITLLVACTTINNTTHLTHFTLPLAAIFTHHLYAQSRPQPMASDSHTYSTVIASTINYNTHIWWILYFLWWPQISSLCRLQRLNYPIGRQYFSDPIWILQKPIDESSKMHLMIKMERYKQDWFM